MKDINENLSRRQSSLDVIKCIAALCVVFIHIGPVYLHPIVRSAVPMFYVISGYYYSGLIAKDKYWQHLRKILIMAICASCLYGIYWVAHELRHGTFEDWVNHTFTLKNVIQLTVFNEDQFRPHLWYFWAILYDLLAFRIIDHFGVTKYLKYIVPFLIISFYTLSFLKFHVPYYRNWLFFGLPCMMIGRWLRESDSKIFRLLDQKKEICLYVIILSLLFVFVESLSFREFNPEMYVFTIPFVVGFFYVALQYPNIGNGSIFATIGQKHSANIFIIHELVVLNFKFVPFSNYFHFTFGSISYPLIIFFLSLLISMAWLRINSFFKLCRLHF